MEVIAKKAVSQMGPTLRFKTFDQPWIRTRLSDLCSSINVGFVGTCEPYYTTPDNGVLLIRTGNVKDGRFDFSDVKYVTRDFHERNKKSQVLPGDLLVARHGSNGQATLVGDDLPESHCLNIVMIRTGPELGQMFLQEQLNSEALHKQIKGLTAGSTQGVINTGALASLEVTAPTLPEQQKIAAFLGAVDRKIQQLKRKQALLEQYKKGVVQQLFAQELRFKREVGGEFPEWEEKTLGDVITRNATGLNPRKNFKLGTGENYYVTIKNIRNGSLDFSSCEKIDDKAMALIRNRSDLRKGDLIMASIGNVGDAFLLEEEPVNWNINESVFALRPSKEVVPRYLFYVLTSDASKAYLDSNSTGSSFKSIKLTELRLLPVPLPSLEEQTRIAGFLMALDAKVAGVAQAVAAAQQWKRGLLQQMFV
jgi:type I restriction enzyme S subunit